jgi:hypothetical protein
MSPYITAFVAVALFPLFLAGIGGHLATLAVEDLRERRNWKIGVWGLAALGILAVGLQQFQSYDSDNVHDKKQEALQQKLDTSIRSEENIKGQLQNLAFVFSKLEARPSSTTDPTEKRVIETLLAASQRAAISEPPEKMGKPGFRGLSNRELREKVNSLVSQIRSIEEQFEKEDSAVIRMPSFDPSKTKPENDQLRNTFLGALEGVHQRQMQSWEPHRNEGRLLLDELLARIPVDMINSKPGMDRERETTQMVLEYDSLAGAYPLRDVANYFERLALILPQPKPTKPIAK